VSSIISEINDLRGVRAGCDPCALHIWCDDLGDGNILFVFFFVFISHIRVLALDKFLALDTLLKLDFRVALDGGHRLLLSKQATDELTCFLRRQVVGIPVLERNR
jgi:hypothetical protein